MKNYICMSANHRWFSGLIYRKIFTKCVGIFFGDLIMAKVSSTLKVVFGPEGGVLKELRHKQGLSMIVAGKLIGKQSVRKLPYSSTYISQIENFRCKAPEGEYLKPFLKIYGDISEKYFHQLCREWTEKTTDEDIIVLGLPKLSVEDKKYLRQWVEDKLSRKF